MNILYVSHLCPDTDPALSKLKEEQVSYEIRDITKSLAYMKKFLSLRDSREEFDPIKEAGQIGIPLLINDMGQMRFDFA